MRKSFAEVPGEKIRILPKKDGKTIAYVIPTEPKGYGGPIKLLTAVSLDGSVMDYTMLEHNETPGLGDNASKPKSAASSRVRNWTTWKLLKTRARRTSSKL